MILSTASRECLEHLGAVRGYSPGTLANYERTHKQFLAYCMAHGLPDAMTSFATEHVMGFVSALGARGVVGNTLLNKIHGLSALARYLRQRRDYRGRPILTADPTKGFDRPNVITPETKFLLPNELAAFLAVPVDANTALSREVLVDTGIRCLEAVEANVGDLKTVGGTVYLSLRVKGRRRAGGAPASIPQSARCAAAVLAHLQQRGPSKTDAPLLLDRRGQRWSRTQLTQAMIRIGQRAGLTRVTSSPHRLRHTANVVARMAGVDALDPGQHAQSPVDADPGAIRSFGAGGSSPRPGAASGDGRLSRPGDAAGPASQTGFRAELA